MIWWHWVIGVPEFVIAWWCTDRLTRSKGIVPEWLRDLLDHQEPADPLLVQRALLEHYRGQSLFWSSGIYENRCVECKKPSAFGVKYWDGTMRCKLCADNKRHDTSIEEDSPYEKYLRDMEKLM